MPQAPDELRALWEDDSHALDQLRGRFIVTRGGMIHPLPSTVPTDKDYSAIDYLCLEWDYGWDADPKGSR